MKERTVISSDNEKEVTSINPVMWCSRWTDNLTVWHRASICQQEMQMEPRGLVERANTAKSEGNAYKMTDHME